MVNTEYTPNHLNLRSFAQAQFHLHMPSEHLIDGRQYSAELHVVHTRQVSVGQQSLGSKELGTPRDVRRHILLLMKGYRL